MTDEQTIPVEAPVETPVEAPVETPETPQEEVTNG